MTGISLTAEDREGDQRSHLELALELRTEVWVATMLALTHRYGKKEKQWVIDHILESMPTTSWYIRL